MKLTAWLNERKPGPWAAQVGRVRRRAAPSLSLERLEDRCLLSAMLVRDINPDPVAAGLGILAAVGDQLYFRASGPGTGQELWVTDGTTEGTRLVKDINPGAADSFPQQLTVLGDRLFFVANVLGVGQELWVTDGTEEGTHLFLDINPGTLARAPGP